MSSPSMKQVINGHKLLNESDSACETESIISKDPSGRNFKRFSRKTNNSFQVTLKSEGDSVIRTNLSRQNSPTFETPKTGRDRNSEAFPSFVKVPQTLPRSPTIYELARHDMTDRPLYRQREIPKQSLQNSRVINTATTNLPTQTTNNRESKPFFKATATNLKATRESESEPDPQKLRQELIKLQRQNQIIKGRLVQLQEQQVEMDSLQRDSENKIIEKLNMEIDLMHQSLMKEQSNALNAQKKLKETNQQLDIMVKERNLILGQLSKLSRAKLPKDFLEFQSLKEMSLQMQLNDARCRLNEQKTQVQIILQEKVQHYQILVRKMQEEASKYEIANRVLLKRAEEAEKFRDGHKNCDVYTRRLKCKYSELLTQYYELKKTNIHLLKQNEARNKMENESHFQNSPARFYKNGVQPFSKASKELTGQFITEGLTSPDNMKTSMTYTTGDSELSMEISFDTETEGSCIYY